MLSQGTTLDAVYNKMRGHLDQWLSCPRLTLMLCSLVPDLDLLLIQTLGHSSGGSAGGFPPPTWLLALAGSNPFHFQEVNQQKGALCLIHRLRGKKEKERMGRGAIRKW